MVSQALGPRGVRRSHRRERFGRHEFCRQVALERSPIRLVKRFFHGKPPTFEKHRPSMCLWSKTSRLDIMARHSRKRQDVVTTDQMPGSKPAGGAKLLFCQTQNFNDAAVGRLRSYEAADDKLKPWKSCRGYQRSARLTDMLPNLQLLDPLAARIEKAYGLRRPRWSRGCSTSRVWFSAALRLWEAHAENPERIPLDPRVICRGAADFNTALRPMDRVDPSRSNRALPVRRRKNRPAIDGGT